MLTGKIAPELGGRPDYLDIAGLNYYPDNQWHVRGGYHSAGPSSLSALARAAGGRPRALRAPALSCGDRGRGQRPALPGSTTSAARCAPRCARECRSRASASTRSWTIRAGRTTGRARLGLFVAADAAGDRTVCLELAEELARQQANARRFRPDRPRPSSPVRPPRDCDRDRQVQPDGRPRDRPAAVPGACDPVHRRTTSCGAAGCSRPVRCDCCCRGLRHRRAVRHAPPGRRHVATRRRPFSRLVSARYCSSRLIALESAFWRLGGWLTCRGVIATGVDIRLDLFEHLSGQPLRYFADHLAGSLGGRITATAGSVGAC